MKYSVNIEKPCSQDWNWMKDNYAGKFCSVCQKSVVDYSQLSDKEVLRVLKQNNFKGCGRFTQKQLNKPFTETANRISFLPFFKVFSGLLLFGTTEKALAEKPKPETFISERKELSSRSGFQKKSVEKDSLKIVKGTVISSEDNVGLPGAIISIEGTILKTYTGIDGEFSLEIPNELMKNDSLILNISFIGFQTERKSIFIEDDFRNLKSVLYIDPTIDLAFVGLLEVKRWWQFWKWQFWRKKYKEE